MLDILLALLLLFLVSACSEDARADTPDCKNAHFEFTGVVASVNPSIDQHATYSFGVDPSYTVIVSPVLSSSVPQRIRVSSDVSLAIHSPTQVFLKDASSLIGKTYRFDITEDDKCSRTLNATMIATDSQK